MLFCADLARAADPADALVSAAHDNSFLVQEAYNQDAGVVQTVVSLELDGESGSREWTLALSQEWPRTTMAASATSPRASRRARLRHLARRRPARDRRSRADRHDAGATNNATGEDIDIARVIREGPAAFGGSPSMPGWKDTFSPEHARDIVTYGEPLAKKHGG